MVVKAQQPAKLPTRIKDPKKVSTRASITYQGQHDVPHEPMPPSPVETACMRMHRLLQAKTSDTPPVVISTVEGLQSFLKSKQQKKIVTRMKLLWISDHSYQQWKLVRLHFVDADSPESLEGLLQVFQVPYKENSSEIDSALLTASMWNTQSNSELLPIPGSVVDITDYSNLQLFCESHCQLTTQVRHLSWEGSDV